jgi:hypothetical protein
LIGRGTSFEVVSVDRLFSLSDTAANLSEHPEEWTWNFWNFFGARIGDRGSVRQIENQYSIQVAQVPIPKL